MIRRNKLTTLIIWLLAMIMLSVAEAENKPPDQLPINTPNQMTSETDSVLYMDISRDGTLMVYSLGSEDLADIWIRSIDPSVVMLPRQLTDEPSGEIAPALSPDKRYIAYVGTTFDVKGDIYLLDITADDLKPIRLTGRDAEEGAPCFSADGNILYFHRTDFGTSLRQIIAYDLRERRQNIVEIGRDGAFPSISPDGTKMAFVSYEDDPAGDIYVYDFRTKETKQTTDSPLTDFFPAWSSDGASVLFSRFSFDTNHDGLITVADNSVVYVTDPATEYRTAYPLTSASYSAIQPRSAGSSLFFLSNRKGINNCWTLPLEGAVRRQKSAAMQYAAAGDIALKIPFDPYLTLAAYYRVLQWFPDYPEYDAKAAYEIGKLYQKIGMRQAAVAAFRVIDQRYENIEPEASLARIEQIVMRAKIRLDGVKDIEERALIIIEAVQELAFLSDPRNPRVDARSKIERARLIFEESGDSQSMLTAIETLDGVIEQHPDLHSEAAEAMILKADIYTRLGRRDAVYPLYLTVIDAYPDAKKWANEAVVKILENALSGLESTAIDDKVKELRRIADDNREKNPMLSAGALNRIGDLYFEATEWTMAKSVYRQVLEQFKIQTAQTAAARLSLAEILYREERFRQAIDLYEEEIDLRTHDDTVYQLARAGYIRKSIAAGEYLYRLGEIYSAKNNFKELIDYDESIVEAHRGYIKCAAALQDIGETLSDYREQLKDRPDNAVLNYAVGLCLTYMDTREALLEARKLLLQAIQINGQIEYFHQTLGYVYEVLETVHNEKGFLEKALAAYTKAYFLNDSRNNPENAANLLLNLGNTYYLLGQYEKAFQYYTRRMETDQPFGNENTELMFYRRLGAAAFQVRDAARTISAFETALELIEKHMDPRKASEAFDRISRFVMDRVIAPALKQRPEEAKKIGEAQSDINRKLADITELDYAPPAPEWYEYKKGIQALLKRQAELNPQIVILQQNIQDPALTANDVQNTLKTRMLNVEEALAFPERLVELEAEIQDRLGLGLQEANEWGKAKEAFQKVFSLNRQLGLNSNLVRNKRAIAFNTYMQAGELSDDARRQVLEEAAASFAEVIELVEKYGVPEKPADPAKEGLISLSVQESMDETQATGAAYGFTAEQEIRIAQSFISRIHIELGEIEAAETSIKAQLAAYPPDQPIADNDLYGVSLLFHRAGHIANALNKPKEAIDDFFRSASLSIQLKSPISTAINVSNAAAILSKQPLSAIRQYISTLETLDNRAKRLLSDAEALLPAAYHNKMGVYYTVMAEKYPEDVERIVAKNHLFQSAGIHLHQAVKYLEKKKTAYNRTELALLSTVHLNIAGIARHLGEENGVQKHLADALEYAARGILPQYRWRALAGLEKYEEALSVLEKMTLLEADCGPGEIMMTFSPLVERLHREGSDEEAFNLVERLSELERFHRLAYLRENIPESEKSLYRDIYPRLLRVRLLRQKIDETEGEEQRYLEGQLLQETRILDAKIGNIRDWDIAETSEANDIFETAAILTGIAVHLQEEAERMVKNGQETADAYTERIDLYYDIRKKAMSARFGQRAADEISFFGPEPVEAIEVMENLPEDGQLIRFFRKDGGFIAFRITPDGLTADDIYSPSVISIPENAYAAYEDPLEIPGECYKVLSATHFVRSALNRKPFKRTLLTIPPISSVPQDYERKRLQKVPQTESLKSIQTLVVTDKIGILPSTPTRAGESPKYALRLENDRGLALKSVLEKFSNLSLAVLADAPPTAAYTFGHLFSIYGAPEILVSEHPPVENASVTAFLSAYLNKSTVEALKEVGAEKQWLTLGYKGMTADEATAFARQHFVNYVKSAQNAYQNTDYVKALTNFENAIYVAKETERYFQYLPQLYQYARESAYLSDNLDKALEYARIIVKLMEREKPDTKEHAEALLRFGLIHAKLEHYEKSVPLLEEAAEMMAALELEQEYIQVLADLGVVLENATEYDRALGRFQSAADLSERWEKEELMARQHMNIGRLYDLRLSQYAKAVQSYDKALTLYDQMDDARGVAEMHINIGRCYRLLGNFPEARKRLRQAGEVMGTDLKNTEIEAKIVIEQANTEWFQGKYEDAFLLQRKAFQIAQEQNLDLMRIIALNTSGLIWWTLGKSDKALMELETALENAKELKTRKDEIATTLNNIGLVYREMGRYEDALAALDEALAIDTELKSRWAIAYDLRNKALTFHRMGKPDKAIPLFINAAVEAEDIGNKINEAKAMLGLGSASLDVGNLADAEKAFQKALTLSESMGVRETMWRSIFGLAQIRLNPKPEEAEDLLYRAIGIIEDMRSEIRIEQLKDSFIGNKLEVYETLVQLLADKGKIKESFEVAERSRARNFIDLLGNQRISLSRTVDQQLYDRQAVLKARIDEQRTLLAQSTTPQERETYQSALNDLQNELDNLMIEIQAKNPQLTALVSVSSLRADDVIAEIEKGVALLSYYVLPNEVFCWLIRPEGMKLYRMAVGRETLGETILDYRRMIQNLEPVDDTARKLHGWLISPLLQGLAETEVLGIIPHNSLHYLSFSTLTDDEAYLIDRFPLFYIPSASILDFTLSRRFDEKNLNVLAIGNPDLGDPVFDLPFAEHEVKSIQWNFPDITILTRERANESWVAANIGRFGIIHLASHGEFDPINPLFSALRLAGGEKEDGNLLAMEVFGLTINADLVVLSACQTGLAKVTAGDDVIGLNRAFIYAGTHTIISSLWRVSDISTAILIKQFYRQYINRTKAESLRRAILHVKARYPHPGYWGAFTLVGDYY